MTPRGRVSDYFGPERNIVAASGTIVFVLTVEKRYAC
jgi:hypothetical protein